MVEQAYQDAYIDVNYLPHTFLADCNEKISPSFIPIIVTDSFEINLGGIVWRQI